MIYAIFFTIICSLSTDIIKDFILLILSMFNIKLYKFTSNIEINKIINLLEIKKHTVVNNNKLSGLILGKNFIGKIITKDSEFDNSKLLYFICNESFYNKKINNNTNYLLKSNINKNNKDNNENDNNKNDNKNENDNENDNYLQLNKQIKFWARTGTYKYFYYLSRNLDLTNVNEMNNQNNIITSIINLYKKKKFLIINLYGDPGVGKTMLCYLLCKKLNGNYCDSWNPTDPNDSLDHIYNEVIPEESKPLILVLEEFDLIIKNITENIKKHKEYPISVTDKMGWNALLDKIQIGIYPNLILILTSNKTPDFINNIDSSYIREGRVDFKFDLKRIKND